MFKAKQKGTKNLETKFIETNMFLNINFTYCPQYKSTKAKKESNNKLTLL